MTLPDRGTFLQLNTLNNQDAADAHAAVRDQVAFNGSAWELATPYVHPCRTRGSDGILYDSVQSSTGQDPVGDITNIYWIKTIDKGYRTSPSQVAITSDYTPVGSGLQYWVYNYGRNIRIKGIVSHIDGGSSLTIANLADSLPVGTFPLVERIRVPGLVRNVGASLGYEMAYLTIETSGALSVGGLNYTTQISGFTKIAEVLIDISVDL